MVGGMDSTVVEGMDSVVVGRIMDPVVAMEMISSMEEGMSFVAEVTGFAVEERMNFILSEGTDFAMKKGIIKSAVAEGMVPAVVAIMNSSVVEETCHSMAKALGIPVVKRKGSAHVNRIQPLQHVQGLDSAAAERICLPAAKEMDATIGEGIDTAMVHCRLVAAGASTTLKGIAFNMVHSICIWCVARRYSFSIAWRLLQETSAKHLL